MDEVGDIKQLGQAQGNDCPAGLGQPDTGQAVALRPLTTQTVALPPVVIMPAIPIQGRLLPEGCDGSGFQVHMLKNG